MFQHIRKDNNIRFYFFKITNIAINKIQILQIAFFLFFLGKFSIIYRNKVPENINKLRIFRLDCKSKKIPLLVANNIDLMREVKADGLYISAHNKKLNLRNFKKGYEIIGGAHNIKEINQKKFNRRQNNILLFFETTFINFF